MVFSHHSHSGEFCGHATDTLEQCIQHAIAKGLRIFALTEHMPRVLEEDLYPEEIALGMDGAYLTDLFERYYTAALKLREKYRDVITLLIGFEVDYIRPKSSFSEITALRQKYPHDIFVGSVHHVNGVPIDFDAPKYEQAIAHVRDNGAFDWGVPDTSDVEEAERVKYVDKNWSGNDISEDEIRLFEAYFDNQYAMLSELRPPVIGHFDLIRLKSSDHSRPLALYPSVWKRIVRNVEFIKSYGGVVELNSAALRKGWPTPYPAADVAGLMRDTGVRFCMSDDSHGVAQVGYGYEKVVAYLEKLGVESVVCYDWEEVTRGVLDGKLVNEEKAVNGHTNGTSKQNKMPEIGKVVMRNIRVGEIREAMTIHSNKSSTEESQ